MWKRARASSSAGAGAGSSTDGCYSQTPKVLLLIREVKLEGGRQRHPSGGVSAKEMVIGLEGVELGADGKVRRWRTAEGEPASPHCSEVAEEKVPQQPHCRKFKWSVATTNSWIIFF